MKRRFTTMLVLHALSLALVLAAAAPLAAADAKGDPELVVGTWALELMFEGQKQAITLEIATKADGTLAGTWIGPHRTNELVDFTWDGHDEGDPASGRGRVSLQPDGSLAGHIYIHHGDDSGFKAVPFEDDEPPTAKSSPKTTRRPR